MTPPAAATAIFRPLALILPACREEKTIRPVLDEIAAALGAWRDADDTTDWLVCVGVNGSPPGDRTAELARRHPLAPLVTETPVRGYGHGCQAVVDELERRGTVVDAFVFFAADGANDPRDLPVLLAARRAGAEFVLGCRTVPLRRENVAVMGWSHVLANGLLAVWCGLLTGRWFWDIGPLRLIERGLFHRLGLREWTFGWTIEAQVLAARLGARMTEVPVRERPRLAGEQKVSKVNWRRTLYVGCQIARAGWRARWRPGLPAAHRPAEGTTGPCPAPPASPLANFPG